MQKSLVTECSVLQNPTTKRRDAYYIRQSGRAPLVEIEQLGPNRSAQLAQQQIGRPWREAFSAPGPRMYKMLRSF